MLCYNALLLTILRVDSVCKIDIFVRKKNCLIRRVRKIKSVHFSKSGYTETMRYQQFIQALEKLKRAPRREEVLLRVLRGQTDTEISEEMDIHLGTVRKQLSIVYEAFGLKSDFEGDRTSKRRPLAELFAKYKPELQKDSRFADIAKAISSTSDTQPLISTLLTGRVPLDSPGYIERDVDRFLKHTFSSHTDESSMFIRIKGSKGMGKSSLLVRLREFLENEHGHTVGVVDLGKSCGSNILASLDKLLYCFTYSVARAFENFLEPKPLDLGKYWRDDLVPGLNCTNYLHQHIFSKLDSPKTLLIDGIDTVLGEKTQTQFLELLRSWNEEEMKKVSHDPIIWPHVVIAYSTEPYASYDMPAGSPLQNVGIPVDLLEFSESHVLYQAARYGLDWDKPHITQLMELIGGHPELINRALYQIGKGKIGLDELISQPDQLNGPFTDYLLPNLKLLQKHSELAKCFVKILNNEDSCDEFSKFRLEKAGLITLKNSKPRVRFELYRRYFQKHL